MRNQPNDYYNAVAHAHCEQADAASRNNDHVTAANKYELAAGLFSNKKEADVAQEKAKEERRLVEPSCCAIL